MFGRKSLTVEALPYLAEKSPLTCEHDAKAFYKPCSQGDSVIYVLLSATKLVSSLAHFQT